MLRERGSLAILRSNIFQVQFRFLNPVLFIVIFSTCPSQSHYIPIVNNCKSINMRRLLDVLVVGLINFMSHSTHAIFVYTSLTTISWDSNELIVLPFSFLACFISSWNSFSYMRVTIKIFSGLMDPCHYFMLGGFHELSRWSFPPWSWTLNFVNEQSIYLMMS